MTDVLRARHLILAFLLLLTAGVCLAQTPELVIQRAHTNSINSVAYSPDGKLAATASEDRTIKLWTFGPLQAIRTLSGHTRSVKSVSFNFDGKLLVSSSWDHHLIVWDTNSGKQLLNLNALSAAFGPDNKLVVINEDRTAKLFSLNGNSPLPFNPECNYGDAILFSADGKTVARWSRYDSVLQLCGVDPGSATRMIDAGEKIVSAQFSPDGEEVAVGLEHSVKLWDVGSATLIKTMVPKSWNDYVMRVSSISFSADGKRIVAGGSSSKDEPNIYVWERGSGKEIADFAFRDRDELAVALSPNGDYVLSGTSDGQLETHTVQSGNSHLAGGRAQIMWGLALSADNKHLATTGAATNITQGDPNNLVKLWDLTSSDPIHSLSEHIFAVFSVAFSPDGKLLASSSDDQTIKFWDTTTNKKVFQFTGHRGYIASIAFSPDGKWLASGAEDGTTRLWSLVTWKEVRSWPSLATQFNIAFSPNGKLLASWGMWGNGATGIKLFDVANGRVVRAIGLDSGGKTVAFSPDSSTIASTVSQDAAGESPEKIVLFNVITGKQIATFAGHSDEIESLAFSPDGKSLVSGSNDQTVKVWDVASGNLIRTLSGHSSRINKVLFNSTGKILISGSEDGMIRFWDASTGQPLVTLLDLDNNNWLAVTPDGLFDGPNSAWEKILWRFNGETFNVVPVESFFSEYYYPGLLADIISGNRPQAKQSIENKDRRLPKVELDYQSEGGSQANTRTVNLKVTVSDAGADSKDLPGAGAQDLRIFRNGSLVKLFHGNLLTDRDDCKSIDRVRTVCNIAAVVSAGENFFTAYAFNRDNVKSKDATAYVQGSDSLNHRGTAYVIAVGINEYANTNYNLSYAVPDAEDFAAEIKRQQEALKQYEKVEVIPLLNKDATRENLLLALSLLSGDGELPAGAPAVMKQIKKAEPEDLVMVYFAGHGMAQDNQFYLIPHNLGYDSTQKISNAEALEIVKAHSISDLDLQKSFEKIDAGHLLLVIDACNSGQVLEAEEKRRGPMNSKGLAQLAYEKGMYILTASQSFQAAQEVSELKHGLLTFVLVEEGLKQQKAEKNENGEIIERKWLDYATLRVPEKQIEKMKQRELEIQNGPAVSPEKTKSRAALLFVEHDNANAKPDDRRVQRPRVFYRRELEANPLIVAKP